MFVIYFAYGTAICIIFGIFSLFRLSGAEDGCRPLETDDVLIRGRELEKK